MVRERNWEDCIKTKSCIKGSIKIRDADSLLETSIDRIAFFKKISFDEGNVNYIFEGYYSSVLELLHAKVLIDGYIVKNHICLSYYLRDILLDRRAYKLFNDIWFKRNALLYSGKRMKYDVALSAIEKCKELIKAFD